MPRGRKMRLEEKLLEDERREGKEGNMASPFPSIEENAWVGTHL
jgi:hypothetical protein